MSIEDAVYKIGEKAELFVRKVHTLIHNAILPQPKDTPPQFDIIRRLLKKTVTFHELLSLKLQLMFLLYLVANFLIVFMIPSPIPYLILAAIPYFIYLRYLLRAYGHFMVDPEPYKHFYGSLSFISFAAFVGYAFMRKYSPAVYYYYLYIVVIGLVIAVFRYYFKHRFGRDYTYGTIEELKNNLVRVFIHDDIAANVKPGLYWLPAVEEAEPGRIVKILVEDRAFRSAKPIRILEVYLTDQSSQTSTEPKEETE